MVFVSVGLASLTQLDLTEDDHKDAMKIICALHIAQTQRNLMRMIDGDTVMHWTVMMEKKMHGQNIEVTYRISLITPCPCLVRALAAHFAPASELYCAPSNRLRNTTLMMILYIR